MNSHLHISLRGNITDTLMHTIYTPVQTIRNSYPNSDNHFYVYLCIYVHWQSGVTSFCFWCSLLFSISHGQTAANWCLLNGLPKTSGFFKEKILNFSLFLRQMLTRIVFCSKNGWGTFNIKLPWFIFNSVANLMISHVSCGLHLEKVAHACSR